MIDSFEDRRVLIEPLHSELSIRRQCELLGVNRSSLYYEPVMPDAQTLEMMKIVDEIYTQHPFFGSRQMSHYLKTRGYDVGEKR